MSDTVRLEPSLLAADAADLGAAVELLDGTVDIFHVDVMDGHFVPNIAMGPSIVEALRGRTDATLDVHLMVENPDQWIDVYREAGADWLCVHHETGAHLERTLSRIRDTGARAGVALNPATMPGGLEFILDPRDFVLVMSVNPGFGGQSFLRASLDKLAALRARLDDAGLGAVQLQIDGGVDRDNAAACAGAGAELLVAGSSVYGADDPCAAAREILALARQGVAAA